MIRSLSQRLIDNRWFWVSAIGLVFMATVLPATVRAWHGHSNDFAHYWNAALAMRNGDDIYTSGEHRYVYPPLLAFLLQPLTFISQRVATVIWICLSGLATVAAVLIVARQAAGRLKLDPSKHLMIAAVAMILSFDKIRSLLSLGQSDAVTLLGFACAFLWMETNPLLAGLAVGASANVKYISLIFVPYFLIKGKYRAAIFSILFFVAFLFVPALQIGLQRSADYALAAFGGIANMSGLALAGRSANVIEVDWNRSVSIPSTIFRLTRACGVPDVAAVVVVLLLFAITIATLVVICRSRKIRIFQRDDRDASAVVEWMTLIVIALVFSPQTTLRHMVLMVLAFAIACGVFLAQSRRQSKIVVACAIGLMTAALTLPPYGIGMNQAVWTWRAIGGASWCALLFLFAITWAGCKLLPGGSAAPSGDARQIAALPPD